MTKAVPVEIRKLSSSYASLRNTLLKDDRDSRLDQPLAYWALPSDRSLPVVFLDQTLRDVLCRSFDELHATPGVGRKKLGVLIKLLLRATTGESHSIPFGVTELAAEITATADEPFDSAEVSEAQWRQWTRTIIRHRLQHETLGRFVPTLQDLPMLAWAQPLLHYTASSAAAIRQMKSHGDKRVHVIFKVFHDLHRQLEHLPHDGNIAVRPTPRFAQEMEGWLIKAATGEQLPDRQAIRRRIAAPLMKQVEVDLSEEVQQLCAGRLGLHGASRRATNLAQSFGFTRVRVYQLLDTCAKAFAVRWPEGRYHLAALAARYHLADPEPHEARQLLDRTRELFYPPKFAAKPKADDA